MKIVKNYFNDVKAQIDTINYGDILKVGSILKKAKKNKKKIYVCGNGGSAANANHISNDLMLGLNKKKQGFPFISLSANFAKNSCIANDLSYDRIYSHQILEIAEAGDVLILLSGSGNSKNIIKVLAKAKQKERSVKRNKLPYLEMQQKQKEIVGAFGRIRTCAGGPQQISSLPP